MKSHFWISDDLQLQPGYMHAASPKKEGDSAPYLNSEQSVGVKEREPLFELFVNLIL